MERPIVSAAELRWVRWRARLGFPLAAICLWLARPSAESILAGAVLAVAGLAVRAAAAGHLRKGETLAMSGPYARTRNPLYFGSALLAAGFVIASRSWIVAALVAAYYLAMYPFLMRREERELRARFGGEFDAYAKRVPLFWPRLRAEDGAGGAQFSWARYAHNREYQTAIGTAALLLGLWALSIWRR
jgi:protein-S-isoprenylcysteine O-methyltransferase Ste14